LGCIAQTAMPVFETRESEIEEFIINKILKSDSVSLLIHCNEILLYGISVEVINFYLNACFMVSER
jgi:hypothetical protein